MLIDLKNSLTIRELEFKAHNYNYEAYINWVEFEPATELLLIRLLLWISSTFGDDFGEIQIDFGL